jgi:hypothetical protein
MTLPIDAPFSAGLGDRDFRVVLWDYLLIAAAATSRAQ